LYNVRVLCDVQLADSGRCPYTKAEYLPEKIMKHTHTHTHTHLQVTWWNCSFDLQSGEQLWNASESVYFHVDWWLCSVDRHKRSQYNTVHVGHINDRKRESGGHINAPLASFTHSSLTPVWCKDYWSGLEAYICYGIIANTSSINNGAVPTLVSKTRPLFVDMWSLSNTTKSPQCYGLEQMGEESGRMV
jgi:hypothetical protein